MCRPNRELVDALYVWQMPPENPLDARLRRFYTLTREAGGGLLFERGIERQPPRHSG